KIAAHPSRVFQIITDRALSKEWLGGQLEIIPGDAPLDRAGAKFTQRMTQGGKAVDYPGQILGYEKNHLLKARTTAPSFDCTAIYRLQMMGTNAHPQTHLEYVLHFRGKTLPGKIFSGVMSLASKI